MATLTRDQGTPEEVFPVFSASCMEDEKVARVPFSFFSQMELCTKLYRTRKFLSIVFRLRFNEEL